MGKVACGAGGLYFNEAKALPKVNGIAEELRWLRFNTMVVIDLIPSTSAFKNLNWHIVRVPFANAPYQQIEKTHTPPFRRLSTRPEKR